MDVTKLAASGVASNRPPTAATDQGAHGAVNVPPLRPPLEIRPLDVPGALLILIAEVRLALVTELAAAVTTAPEGAAQAPGSAPADATQAAQVVIELLLQAIPEDVGGVAVWSAVAARVESAVQQGFDEALRTVTNWHSVSPTVIDAPRDARSVFNAALSDEVPNPLWLRPEWLGLAPRVARYVRRRRRARRRLSDPDYSQRGLDDADWE